MVRLLQVVAEMVFVLVFAVGVGLWTYYENRNWVAALGIGVFVLALGGCFLYAFLFDSGN